MKPSELRLGNHILGQYYDEDGETELWDECKVIGLNYAQPNDEWPIWVEGIGTKLSGECFNQFKGITLTDQRLKEFGFENDKIGKGVFHKDCNGWHYQIEKHPSYTDGYIFFIDIDGVSAPPSVRIKYAHSLQNLIFALTGKELVRK